MSSPHTNFLLLWHALAYLGPINRTAPYKHMLAGSSDCKLGDAVR